MSDPIPSRALALSTHHLVSLLVPPPDRLALVCVSVFLRVPLSFTHFSLFQPPGGRVLNPCDPSAVGRVVIMSSLPVGRPFCEPPPTPSRRGSSIELPALPPLSGASETSRTVPPGLEGRRAVENPRELVSYTQRRSASYQRGAGGPRDGPTPSAGGLSQFP